MTLQHENMTGLGNNVIYEKAARKTPTPTAIFWLGYRALRGSQLSNDVLYVNMGGSGAGARNGNTDGGTSCALHGLHVSDGVLR